MLNPFPVPDLGQNGRHLVEALRCGEQGNGVPDCLGGCIAEDTLGTLVPTRDDAVQSLTDNRVVRRFDQGGEPVRRQFGAGELINLIYRRTIRRRAAAGNFFRHTCAKL